MQQTTGYVIKAAQPMRQRKGKSLEKNTLLLHREKSLELFAAI